MLKVRLMKASLCGSYTSYSVNCIRNLKYVR